MGGQYAHEINMRHRVIQYMTSNGCISLLISYTSLWPGEWSSSQIGTPAKLQSSPCARQKACVLQCSRRQIPATPGIGGVFRNPRSTRGNERNRHLAEPRGLLSKPVCLNGRHAPAAKCSLRAESSLSPCCAFTHGHA